MRFDDHSSTDQSYTKPTAAVSEKVRSENTTVMKLGTGVAVCSRRRWGCGLAVLLILWPRQVDQPAHWLNSSTSVTPNFSPTTKSGERVGFPLIHSASTAELTPEQIVARKLGQFARSRREFAAELARRHHIQVPGDVEQFFAAVESGNWDEIEAAFKKINGGDSSASQTDRPPGVAQLWPAIIDAYGVAEQVHEWPAQKLLDYGNAILDALRPGMVYVGGTDNGRWIPELLNDTSDGEHHIVVTQNGLADGTYQDYLRLQYDDRLANLSDEESKRAFDAYAADAQKRLEHDQQFPNEPKQLLPGEDVRLVNGKVEVSAQVAVMAINERLIQTLMQKNPDLSFALQESIPLKGTYADALPLGPLMELSTKGDHNAFTQERAQQSLDYWRNTADQIASDPEAVSSPEVPKSYSHDAVAAAHLLAAHELSAEAEQAYRLAATICPWNPESANGLADLLSGSGRAEEAARIVDEFSQKYPEVRAALERMRVSSVWVLKAN
jgi:hypothetical protein